MSALRTILLLGALLVGASGCQTEGFCFDNCTQKRVTVKDAGPTTPVDSGGVLFNPDSGQCVGPGCPNGAVDSGQNVTCTKSNGGTEICDGIDNDCDGKTDEPGTPPDGIDFTDPHTCGNCATHCTDPSILQNVDTPICKPPTDGLGTTAGTCDYDSCAPNHYDVDGNRANGCEYACPWNPNGTNVDLGGDFGCGRDDDCNGIIDDGLDYCKDPQNCGGCGFTCKLPNTDQAECATTSTDGQCDTSNTHCIVKVCSAGFVDANNQPTDGCEYPCVPTNGGVEICDGKDNDCDGKTDNADDSLTDPALGVSCQGGDKGVCADPANAGVMKCIDGVPSCCDVSSNNVTATNLRYPAHGLSNNVCAGTDPPFVIVVNALQEVCNGKDDNCDGQIDGATVDSGAICGTSVGTCHTGHTACVGGALVCPDATPPDPNGERCDGLDNDCDGVIDFTAPKQKISCTADADCVGHAPDVACVQLSSSTSDKGCVALPLDIADGTGTALACDVTPPPPAGIPQPCRPGTLACFGGVPFCQGSVKRPLDIDRCGEDTNCDGQLTGQTNLANNDPKNCGACGNDCNKGGTNAIFQCQAGTCVQSGCQPGFIECGGTSPTDCETACTFEQSTEVCDGRDNNCNCQIDEGTIVPPSVIQACGVSSAATDPGCVGKVTLACTNGGWKCTFTDPAYCTGGNCPATPDICDGKDNNCDGVIDEGFRPPAILVGFLGQSCFSDDGKPLPGDGPCRTQGAFVCKADGTGTQCSATKDATKATTEVCDGVDNNCNGLVDDALTDPRIGVACFGGTKGVCALPANAGAQQCVNGAVSCGGPKLVHPGDRLETCNGLDDDCSGSVDDNLTDTGTTCGSGVGECKTGTQQCVSGALKCNDAGPTPEKCDGLDNNCNGQPDDNPTDVGTPCNVPPPPPTGIPQPCKAGVFSCIGGSKQCQGSVTTTATLDACGEDTNCDGKLTNQTGLSNTDVLNCGACGNNCNTKDPAGNSVWACQAGACVHTGCKTGFIDCDGNTNTCERACTITSSTESCNGKDDNCDCAIDNSVPAATPVQVCGVSPSATDAGCTSGVTTTCTAGAWKCTFPAGYCTGASCGVTSESCDGKDNNCNGVSDETFKPPFLTSGFLGQSCTTPATDGPCQGSGAYVCNAGGTATTCNATKDASKSKSETCNGIDDNCNGIVDDSPSGVGTQCFGGTLGECAAVAHAGATACQSGALVCTGVNLLKPGQLAETCNLKDDDCDGTVDDNPTDVGGACGSGIGACVPGTFVCDTGVKTCKNAIAGTLEKCNGIDDDCNGTADDNPTDVGGNCNVPPAAPPATTQCPVVAEPCSKGTLVCNLGVPQCQGSVTASSSVPDACCTDSNCDGVLTNQPDFQTDITNCGGCGINCNTVNAGKHGVWACQSGACVRTACVPGFVNCDAVNGDCERACTFSGAELCNGVDDDCNCQVDDNIPVSSTPTPSQVCGVSASASDPKCQAGDGTTGVKVQCNTGAWKCTFPAGYCDKGTPATCSTTTDLCDTKDNNCNGATDENFKQPVLNTGYINQPCASDDGKPPPGDGQCKGTGSFQCSTVSATACNAVRNNAAATQEVCDAADNDCDGLVDEPFSNKGTGTYVSPAVVKIGAALWIYQYEASRPTATPATPGAGDGYYCTGASCTCTGTGCTAPPPAPAGATLDKTPACSVSGNIPWFNVSPVEVEQTCQAMGGFVCPTATWTTACQASSGTCTWGYGTGCTTPATYTSGSFCNLGPFDFDGVAGPPNSDGLLPAGGGGKLSSCYALWGAGALTSIFDITGNLREITRRAANDYPLMGGAFNTMSESGAQCDFSFYSVPTTFKFSDAGFRCCFSADPT